MGISKRTRRSPCRCNGSSTQRPSRSPGWPRLWPRQPWLSSSLSRARSASLTTGPSTTPGPTALAYGATGQTAGTTGGLQVLAAAPVANTFDVHKVVVLLVNFSNDQSQPTTKAYTQTVMAAVDQFYRENSYQQTSL